jgi:hypothetical protein
MEQMHAGEPARAPIDGEYRVKSFGLATEPPSAVSPAEARLTVISAITSQLVEYQVMAARQIKF